MHKKGLKTWKDLWDQHSHQWYNLEHISREYNLKPGDSKILQQRMSLWDKDLQQKFGIDGPLEIKGLGWTPLFPITKMETAPSIHVILNNKWGVRLDRKQLYFKFEKLWTRHPPPNISTHLWLILHHGLWIGSKVARIGIGIGLCPKCRQIEETLIHLFFTSFHNFFCSLLFGQDF